MMEEVFLKARFRSVLQLGCLVRAGMSPESFDKLYSASKE